MAAQGIKIHQIKKHTYVSFLVAVICLFIGLQYIEIPEMRQTGILAVVLGLLMLIAAVYMFVTPVIILTDDLIHFRSGNAAKKDVAYAEIKSWSLKEDRQIVLQLKSDKAPEGKMKNIITVNYRNLDKKNQEILIGLLNKKGIQQISSGGGSAEL